MISQQNDEGGDEKEAGYSGELEVQGGDGGIKSLGTLPSGQQKLTTFWKGIPSNV